MNIAIIPARSQSKRIKNKNIKKFMGKPIIAWSIEAAKKSKIFDEIIVSTDSKKISKIAIKHGAKIPFLRSSKLSDDKSNLIDVMSDVAKFYLRKKIKIDYMCLIYATSPLLMSNNLIKAYKKIKKNKKLDYVLSASKLKGSYFRSFRMQNGRIYPLFKKNVFRRSQDVTDLYYESAQFIFGRAKSWIMNKHPYLSKTSIIEIDNYKSQDIDNINDWKTTEKIFQIYYQK